MNKKIPSILVFLFTLFLSSNLLALKLNDQAFSILQSTFGYDKTYPLNARTTGQFQKNGYSFETFVFDSFHDGRVPGLLALPKKGAGKGKAPYPIVFLLHGITSKKESWLDSQFTHGWQVTEGLLKKGYAVLALDAQYHGDRIANNDYMNAGEMVFKHKWFTRYSNLITQTIVDYRRAIDYIENRKDIDASRVGILGYSMGGHMGLILAATDDRFNSLVACVVPETPGLPAQASSFVSRVGHLPLLMLMAKDDEFYTEEQAQNLFDTIPNGNKMLKFYDSGHSLPKRYTKDAVKWISEKL